MEETKIFKSEEFGEVRTAVIDGEPWFVGKDIAEVLGYEDKLNDKTASSLGQRGGWFVNESGLYSLILSSNYCSG